MLAGFTHRHSQRSAWASARWSTTWTRWTVPAVSGVPFRPPQLRRRPVEGVDLLGPQRLEWELAQVRDQMAIDDWVCRAVVGDQLVTLRRTSHAADRRPSPLRSSLGGNRPEPPFPRAPAGRLANFPWRLPSPICACRHRDWDRHPPGGPSCYLAFAWNLACVSPGPDGRWTPGDCGER